MGIWDKPGAVKQLDPQVVAHLRQLAQGYNSQGQPIPHEHQLAAITQYNSMVAEQQRLQLDSSRVANEAALANNDADRVQNERLLADTAAATARVDAEVKLRQIAIEEGRLQLEAHVQMETLQIQKAEVFTKALIAMIERGGDPEKLLPYLTRFGEKMLAPPEEVPKLLLTDNQRKHK